MTQNDPTLPPDAPDRTERTGSMHASERQATAGLAAVFALRMGGLFLVYPVLSLHADGYADATPLLVGLALGIHGLTQALFQLPFGVLSDRVGRKPVIAAGLLLFAAGSAVAALSDTLAGVVAGRALQGVGAIGAAVLALAADLTRESQRGKAMAAIGISIGVAFLAAQVIGPLLGARIGLAGLFWTTALLALACVAVLVLAVPTPPGAAGATARGATGLGSVLLDRRLLRLDAGVLVLHLTLTATFVALPLALRDAAGVAAGRHWMYYAGAFAVALAVIGPAIAWADRSGRHVRVLRLSAGGLAAALGAMALGQHAAPVLAVALAAFFTAFTLLEALLPSTVSRLAPAGHRGAALAAFTTSHFAGTFAGGLLGGWLLGDHGLGAVFAVGAGLVLAWVALTAGLRDASRGDVAPGPPGSSP